MELKFILILYIRYMLICFNRTFMELKYNCLVWSMTTRHVLIAPLWN